MSLNEARLARNTALTILALVALRLVAAAWTPLTFDEAYYWMWSKHLAGGYYDHPPMVALVIRLGTMIAGDTELGVRLVSILLALPMSWAVYRTAAILFGGMARGRDRDPAAQRDADGGGRHPDRHAGCAAAGRLEFRAVFSRQGAGDRTRRVVARGRRRGRRGAAVEIHRAVFRPGDPDLAGQRARTAALADLARGPISAASWRWRCLRRSFSGTPIINGSPSSSRSAAPGSRISRSAFIGELIPTQIAFATPLVWILGAMGLYALLRRNAGALGRARADQHHVLDHRRSISSGIRCTRGSRPTGSRRSIRRSRSRPRSPPIWCAGRRAASVSSISACAGRRPSGVVMFALLVVQANTGVLSGYRRDATVRSVGVGWRELAAGIEAVRDARRRRLRAGAGLRHHRLACLLSAEGHLRRCSRSQRIRWVNMPEPDPALLAGKLLYVDEVRPGGHPQLEATVRPCRAGRGTAAQARPAHDRNLRARSAGRRREARCSTARRRRSWSRTRARVEAEFGIRSWYQHFDINRNDLREDAPAELPACLNPPALNPHLTKSRLNDAPRLCEMLRRHLRCITGRLAFGCAAPARRIERCLQGEQGGTSLDARRMSTSTRACCEFAVPIHRKLHPAKPALRVSSAAPRSPASWWGAPGRSMPMFSAPASIRR